MVRSEFPAARLIELDHAALPGEARNAGLRAARGRYVTFPGSHVTVSAGALHACVRAHRMGYAMVSGTMLNGTTTWSGWASYLLDNSTVLPGRTSQPLTNPPIRCSYLRDALLEVDGFPEDMRAGEDTAVNGELFARGYSAYREQNMVFRHYSPCRHPARLVTHHFVRGRALGRLMFDGARAAGRFPDRRSARFAVLGLPARVRTIWRNTRLWGPELRWRLWIASPLVLAGAFSAWAGACYELIRRARPAIGRMTRDTSRPDRRPAPP